MEHLKIRHVYEDKSVYVGEWVDGKRNGEGTWTAINGDTYTGSWINDKRHGQGVEKWELGRKYNGEYKNGMKDGKGIFTYTGYSTYEGGWKEDKKHGEGAWTTVDGYSTKGKKGIWKNDVRVKDVN